MVAVSQRGRFNIVGLNGLSYRLAAVVPQLRISVCKNLALQGISDLRCRISGIQAIGTGESCDDRQGS